MTWFKSRSQGRGYVRHDAVFVEHIKKRVRIRLDLSGQLKVVPIDSLQPK